MLVHAPHPCKGDLFVPFGKLMSAQEKCIYSWENGNGALAYYRGGSARSRPAPVQRGVVLCLSGDLCLLRKSVSTPGKMEMAH